MMPIMTATMDLIADFAGHVWKAIGVELVIFGVTVCVALAVRVTSHGHSAKPTKKLARKSVDTEDEKYEAKTWTQKKAGMGAAGGWRDSAAKAATSMDAQRPQTASSQGVAKREPWQLVDDIFSLVQNHPGQRSTGQVLQVYSHLRRFLGLVADNNLQSMDDEKAVTIAEATRYTQQSAVDLYSTLVHCAVRSGQCHLVERLVDDMVQLSVTRSCAFYESTMKQLAGQKHYRLALNIYDRLCADGLEPSAVTCSCLVSFATEIGEHKRALHFFDKLSSMTTPSIRAYMTVLRVHAQQQDWPSSLLILRDMQKRGILLDSLTLNVVLATGVATDNLEEADGLLADTESMGRRIADVVSYNTIIKGYARLGDVAATSKCLERMRKRGLSPNSITFNTMMDAAVRGPNPSHSWGILKEMRLSGFLADKFTCSILIKGLAKQPTAAHVQAAMDLLQDAGNDCDSMLKSTLYHGVLDAASQASDDVLVMQIVSRMRQHNIALNESATKRLRERTGRSSAPSLG